MGPCFEPFPVVRHGLKIVERKPLSAQPTVGRAVNVHILGQRPGHAKVHAQIHALGGPHCIRMVGPNLFPAHARLGQPRFISHKPHGRRIRAEQLHPRLCHEGIVGLAHQSPHLVHLAVNLDLGLGLHPPDDGFTCDQVVKCHGGRIGRNTKTPPNQPVAQRDLARVLVFREACPVRRSIQQPVTLIVHLLPSRLNRHACPRHGHHASEKTNCQTSAGQPVLLCEGHGSSLTCQKVVVNEEVVYAQGISVGLCARIGMVSLEFKPDDKGIVLGFTPAQVNGRIGHAFVV